MLYDADVSITPDSGSLTVRATLRYTVVQSDERRLALLLNRALTVHSLGGAQVVGYDVQPSDFSPSWNQVTVSFADSVTVGSVVDLHIAYSGQPEMPEDGINRITSAWVELGLDSQWFPIVSTFAEQLVGDLRVTLPSGWSLVSSGSTATNDSTIVVRNRVQQIDVTLAASPSMQRAGRERVAVHHRTMSDSAVTAVLDAAGYCVQQLDARFGARDTFPVARIVLAERDGPGYARKNYIVLSAVNTDEPEAMYQFLCHEVSHYWTRSPGAFSPDHWMSEAFAEYSAAVIVRERFGEEAFARLRGTWEEGGRAVGPVWTPESTNRPSFQVMYRRAPWLLARLEERIGVELFARFLARVMVARARTTPQMLDVLEAEAGAEAAEWFEGELAAAPTR